MKEGSSKAGEARSRDGWGTGLRWILAGFLNHRTKEWSHNDCSQRKPFPEYLFPPPPNRQGLFQNSIPAHLSLGTFPVAH